jgi:hypothetical protein
MLAYTFPHKRERVYPMMGNQSSAHFPELGKYARTTFPPPIIRELR